MMRLLLTSTVAGLALAAPYAPCRAPYATPAALAFETPCFDTLATLGATSVRRYPATAPAHARAAQVVHINLTGVITNFNEAVLNGVEFLFCYFAGACSTAHASLYDSRTVPLLVRPPQRGGGGGDATWAIDKAAAPPRWPGAAPAGENGIDIVALDALVAARHCTARGPPVEADFLECLTALEADTPALRKAGFAVDAAGEWSPAFAYYSFQNQSAPPFDFEVWESVTRVSVGAVTAPAAAFAHPGVLVGAADVAALRQRFQAHEEPTDSFYMAAYASGQGSAREQKEVKGAVAFAHPRRAHTSWRF